MSELVAAGFTVTVSVRVVRLSRQSFYRWRNQEVVVAEVTDADRARVLIDARRDDPAFGH